MYQNNKLIGFEEVVGLLCFCTRKAFAACVYRSAAFSHFSDRPPKKLKPPVAPEAALSAFCSRALGSCAIVRERWGVVWRTRRVRNETATAKDLHSVVENLFEKDE